MLIKGVDPLEPKGGTETPEKVVRNRRKFLLTAAATVATAGASIAGYRWYRGSDDDVLSGGQREEISKNADAYFPATRDDRFRYGRAESEKRLAE